MKRRRNKLPFSKNLISLMQERGITIREAAKLAGVSHSTIDSWRSGRSPEDFIAVQKLATSLGTTLSFLLTGVNDNSYKNHTITEVFEEGEVIIDGYARLTIKKLIPRRMIGED